jgi:hypothetical protein
MRKSTLFSQRIYAMAYKSEKIEKTRIYAMAYIGKFEFFIFSIYN